MKRVSLRIVRTWGRDRPLAINMRREGIDAKRLVHGISLSQDYTRLVIETTAEQAAFERVLSRTEAVTSYEIVPGSMDRIYVFYEEETRPIEAAMKQFLDELGLVLVPPMVYTNRTITVELAGEESALRRAFELIPADVEFELERFGDYQRGETSRELLTDRQREAVTVAIDLEYYAIPRQGSVRDIATQLDCAPSTATNLLRRAEGRIIQEFVSEQPSHHAIR